MPMQELGGKVLLQHTSTPTLLAVVKAGAESKRLLLCNSHKQCCLAPLSGGWCSYEVSEQLGNEQEKKTQLCK